MKHAHLLLWIAVCAAAVAPVGAAETGGLRYSVTVSQFENEAGWYGHWDIGNAWGTVLTDLLNQSGRFIVLGETDMRYEAMPSRTSRRPDAPPAAARRRPPGR